MNNLSLDEAVNTTQEVVKSKYSFRFRKEAFMEICKTVGDISWRPHPIAEGVNIKPLATKSEDDLNVTCMLLRIPPGKEIPEHIHEEQVDILYPMQGESEMYVEGTGTFPLKPGIVVRVPKGTKHKISNVTEELLIYDVFQPATL
jgi:quercetin dioxygenase-like cupin family protein